MAAAGEDHLGITDDVNMLADVVASKDVVPPLSVGLVGGRGSGRSFFMRRMEGRVEALAEEAAGDIVQVRFSAWSPADDDVTARLTGAISDALGADRQADERREVVAALADVRARDIVAELAGDEELATLRREAAEKLGLSEVNVRELRDLSTDMSRLGGQASAVGRLLMKDSHRRRMLVGTGFLIAVLAVVGWGLTSGQGRPWGLGLVALVGALVIGATGIAIWVRPVLDTASEGLDALSQAVAKADAVESAFSEHSARQEVVLSHELKSLEEGETAAGSDLERLAQLLQDGDRRVIVYVDDVDRLPPARAEEARHAVHALLALPVVVVVAVDGDDGWLFDIPFRVAPLNDGALARLVRSMMAAEITEAEVACLAGFAEAVATPWAARRLAHVYRLLRASLSADELAAYLEDKEYETVLGLLADPGSEAPAELAERWGPRLARFTVR